MPSPTLLHSAHSVTWAAWHLEPSVAVLATLVAFGYLYVALRTATLHWRKASLFYGGASLMLLSLVSPLDAAAERLLSMHMLQHVVLTTLGPPLVLLGLAPPMLTKLTQPGTLQRLLRPVLHPFTAAAAMIVAMWFWHAPPLYEAALTQTSVHATMHVTFMAAGLLFWWPVIQPLASKQNLSNGARLFYLFVTGFPMEVLALLLIASGSVVYSYYESSPGLWGFSPIEDQQVGGIVMGAIGQAAAFVAITLLFFRYLDAEERRELSRSST